MDLKQFKKEREQPIYSNLSDLYDTASLNLEERAIFDKYKNTCEYWLLRSKRPASYSFNKHPSFIQCLARVLINLQSKKVTGKKEQLVKEMFGDKKIHRVYPTKNGVRSTISSNKVFNTFFELKIMSFFLEHNFEIVLSNATIKGVKIPEFVAKKGSLHINVEAKYLDIDKVLDHIYGDTFIEGIDFKATQETRDIGDKKTQSSIEKNYESAMQKLNATPDNEYFILFLSICDFSLLGKASLDYLNDFQAQWENSEFNKLIGIIIPQDNKTVLIPNNNCNLDIVKNMREILEFHLYIPEIIKNES